MLLFPGALTPLHSMERTMRRLVPILTLVALILTALITAAPHLAAQVVSDSSAQLPIATSLAGIVALAFSAAGSTIYQVIKKAVSPLDKLGAPWHMAITAAANFAWQALAPVVKAKYGIELPGDLSAVGPVFITGALTTVAMWGFHGMISRVTAWLKAKVGAVPA